jgi:hypothetical protein
LGKKLFFLVGKKESVGENETIGTGFLPVSPVGEQARDEKLAVC